MYPRVEYEMSEEDLKAILDACKPVPMIMLNVGMPSSPQENANRAWQRLGEKMGFDYMTVRPSNRGDRFFTAVPLETEQHRMERVAREEKEKTEEELADVTQKIEELQLRRTVLRAALEPTEIEQTSDVPAS